MLLSTQQCSSNHGVRFKLATKGVTKRKGQMLPNFSEMEANPRFTLRSYGVVLFDCTALRPFTACTSLGFPVLVLGCCCISSELIDPDSAVLGLCTDIYSFCIGCR